MPERSRSDEFMSRQHGPGNANSFTRTSTSFTSATSTTRGRDPSRGGGASPDTSWRRGGPHPQHPTGGASAYPRPTSFSLHSLGDFDTLETRLQKALDSPTLLVRIRKFMYTNRCQFFTITENLYCQQKLENDSSNKFVNRFN